ncbi:hypothetical protein FA15DRAFT_641126 [Coprinopsis marcescibilis]|uniref:F-box domain-containing protein n=1 Tax=Coprinopsis marcescibilis TaxID=230819 RepID=A0A5C3KVA5_COPMA|nr:hypothetical protein FA15DRAFT_641126 [Coprinopsis marcescibilis]
MSTAGWVTAEALNCTCLSTRTTMNSYQRLPPELLLHIFEEACLSSWRERKSSQSRVASRLLVGGVCRRWRCVIQTTSTFWSQICVVLSESADTNASQLRYLEYCIERSEKQPLSICIQQLRSQKLSLDPQKHEKYRHAFAEAIDLLAPHSERWMEIDFFIPRCTPCPSLQKIKGRLPSLQFLDIQVSSFRYSIRDHQPALPLESFSSAPRLSTLHYPADRFSLEVDWTTLTSFTCASLSLREALYILTKSVNLRSCNIKIFHSDFDGETSLISLRFLKTLVLRDYRLSTRVQLLDWMVLPALNHLAVNATVQGQAIQSLLLRSSCNATVQRLGGSGIRGALETAVSGLALAAHT